ncbi:MAG: DUF721 domain-containing protein [Rickettsiales bacterium]|jgi:hypothetical protein|nr:DUF721 domain-containing protein [Rickettsiales bacterium]
MANPVNLNKRTARPQTIASTFGGLMRLFGVRASDADLSNRWDEIMGGDIASIARLAAITKTRDKKFNIAVRAANPAFALQLSYMKDDIAAKINKYFGYDAVAKVTIRK